MLPSKRNLARRCSTAPEPNLPRLFPGRSNADLWRRYLQRQRLLIRDISFDRRLHGTAGATPFLRRARSNSTNPKWGMQPLSTLCARRCLYLLRRRSVTLRKVTSPSHPFRRAAWLKVGQDARRFGKVQHHPQSRLWPFIDRPLVTNNLVGGRRHRRCWHFPFAFPAAPKKLVLQGTAQVYRGDSSDVFTANRRQDVSVVGHLRIYRDLGESTNSISGLLRPRSQQCRHCHNSQSFPFPHESLQRGMPLFVGSRSAAPSTILSSSAQNCSGSARDQLSPLNVFSQPSTLLVCTPIPNTASNRRWDLGGRFDRSAAPPTASLTDTGFPVFLPIGPASSARSVRQYRYGIVGTWPNDRFTNAQRISVSSFYS